MATIAAFITSLIFNIGITLVLLAIFSILRPRFDFVYQPNFKLLTELISRKIPETKLVLLRKLTLSSAFYAWLTPAFKVNISELYDLVGFDAFVYLRFLRLCLSIAVLSLPYAAVVLIPVNVYGGNNEKGMTLLTLGNISQHSQKLWAHLIGVWLFSFLVYYLLYTEWQVYFEYRQKYLKEKKENHLSVLITQLPPEVKFCLQFNHGWWKVGPVHTDVFWNWKRKHFNYITPSVYLSKMHWVENIENEAKWKRILIVLVWTIENGAFWTRWGQLHQMNCILSLAPEL